MIAFALQGGGSLSAAEVGMLRALTEHGIVPDLVVGASAGALSGVVVSAWGYPVLALVAAISTVPLMVLSVWIRMEVPRPSRLI